MIKLQDFDTPHP